MNLAEEGVELLAEIVATTNYDLDAKDPGVAWVDGYQTGYSAAIADLSDQQPNEGATR